MGSESNCMWRLKLITGPPPLLPDGPQPMLLQTPSPTLLDRHRVLCCVLRVAPPRRCCCPDTCSGVCRLFQTRGSAWRHRSDDDGQRHDDAWPAVLGVVVPDEGGRRGDAPADAAKFSVPTRRRSSGSGSLEKVSPTIASAFGSIHRPLDVCYFFQPFPLLFFPPHRNTCDTRLERAILDSCRLFTTAQQHV